VVSARVEQRLNRLTKCVDRQGDQCVCEAMIFRKSVF